MYKVVIDFTDLQDDNHVYLAGDDYPRKGAEPSQKRIKELSSDNNKRGVALIEAVERAQKAEIQPVKAEKAKADETVGKTVKKSKKANKKEK